MKTTKIFIYLIQIIAISSAFFIVFQYSFNSEKNKIIEESSYKYRINTNKLIVENIYEDLLLGNLLEANRKLLKLQEEGIIQNFEIIPIDQPNIKKIDNCEIIYFDRVTKKNIWGKLCLLFSEKTLKLSEINFERISFIFLLILSFFSFLIFYIYQKIKKINKDLLNSIKLILTNEVAFNPENSIWEPVLVEMKRLVLLNNEKEKIIFSQKLQTEKIELANIVSHDMRAPLATINNLIQSKSLLNEEQKLIKIALNRLNGLANSLLNSNEYNNEFDILSIHNFNEIIENAIKTKKIEYPNFEIYYSKLKDPVFIEVDAVKFESIISNILTNAIEATRNISKIEVESALLENKLRLTIKDYGKGIPEEVLLVLGKEKITFDKAHGNGFGIYYASKIIKKWAGQFQIYSKINLGTEVVIYLPTKQLEIEKTSYILLDNDELVSMTWELKAKKAKIDLFIFKNSNDLLNSINKFNHESQFYIDSELDSEKGEDVAFKLFNLGFNNLFICSGHPPEKFSHLSYIKKVITKSPPF